MRRSFHSIRVESYVYVTGLCWMSLWNSVVYSKLQGGSKFSVFLFLRWILVSSHATMLQIGNWTDLKCHLFRVFCGYELRRSCYSLLQSRPDGYLARFCQNLPKIVALARSGKKIGIMQDLVEKWQSCKIWKKNCYLSRFLQVCSGRAILWLALTHVTNLVSKIWI